MFCSLQFSMTVMHGGGSVGKAWPWKHQHEVPVGHKVDTGTGGVASFSGSTHHTASYSRTLYGSHACMMIATCSLGSVCQMRLRLWKVNCRNATFIWTERKEKGVMSGVMLILWNLYVTRVLLPS